MYASVRWSRGPDEHRRGGRRTRPGRRCGPPARPTSTVKNAVISATRAACCMLWVTMTIVYSSLSCCTGPRSRWVAIGSSAEAGSSISTTSGSTASARAMHRRCCWPPERDRHASLSRPSPRPTARHAAAPARPVRQVALHAVDREARTRRCRRSTSGRDWDAGRPCRSAAAPRPGRRSSALRSYAVVVDAAVTEAPGTRSFIRFRLRSSVVFPHPEGPMNAVIWFFGICMVTSRIAGFEP